MQIPSLGQMGPQMGQMPPQMQAQMPGQMPPQMGQMLPQSVSPNPQKKPPVEFDHAINYVNKIKLRFQNQPDIYKSFLDILHIYQKEQKSIKEVYEQVASLFRQHPDLLEEFTQFLPEAGAPHQQHMQNHSNMFDEHKGPQIPPPSAPATAENFTQPTKRLGGGNKAPSQTKSLKRPGAVSPTRMLNQSPAIKKQKFTPSNKPGQVMAAVPNIPSGSREFNSELKIKQGSFEEIEYFDKVKKMLNNKFVYAEFLKCLNMFSQEIINKQELVQLVQNFLGKTPELFDWFKRFVGYKEPASDKIPQLEKIPVVDYSKCKRYGPSYRALPKTYIHPKCSGRTDLCNETLNDIWVSFPIWSEDTPFLSTKKNNFEEAIFRAEDERYELDRVIEANAVTIKTFDAVYRKIQALSPEEAQKYRLQNNLGGTSEVIYHRAIKRIYGDKAQEVIEGLKKHPAVAIPVVLTRLKQKEEEWKKAQKEWRKIWADVYAKNFYRALDYQGIVFKQNDKKTTNQKTLVQEAELLFQEHKEKEGEGLSNPANQYEFYFHDESIFDEIIRLTDYYLEKTTGITHADRDKIMDIMHNFIPHFFFLKRLSTTKKPAEGSSEPKSTTGQSETATNQDNKEKEPKEKEEQEKEKDKEKEKDQKENGKETAPMELDSAGPSASESKDVVMTDANPSANSTPPVNGHPELENSSDENVFYANGTLYALIRLVQFAYARLRRLKELQEAAKTNPNRFGQINPVAEQLGLQTPPFNPSMPIDNFYPTTLEYLEQFLEGKMDQNRFEDCVREMFGIDSFPVFTFDKLIHSIAKQVQSFSMEDKSDQMLMYYKQNSEKREQKADYSHKDEQNYQMAVEHLVADDYYFKLIYNRKESQLGIQVLSKQGGNRELNAVEERWSRYVDQYMKMDSPSSYVPKYPVFLKRNKKIVQEKNPDPSNLESISKLECKICVNTYKMFFVENSEDYFHRRNELGKSKAILLQKLKQKKNARFYKFLNSEKGWCGNQSQPALLEKKCQAFLLGEGGKTQRIEVGENSGGGKFCKYVAPIISVASSSTSSNSSNGSSTPNSTNANGSNANPNASPTPPTFPISVGTPTKSSSRPSSNSNSPVKQKRGGN